MVYSPGLQFHSQFWVTLTWHSLGCGDALPMGFHMRNVPFFPWGLPGEGPSRWDIVISWCQSLRRVFKRNPPHPCVHLVTSCWCLVLNIQNLAGKGPLPITSPKGSSQQRAGGFILINICEILFVSFPALPQVKVFFPAGGFLCSLMRHCDRESALTGGILVLFVRIHSISGLFTLTPGALGFILIFFVPHAN